MLSKTITWGTDDKKEVHHDRWGKHFTETKALHEFRG